MAVATHSGMSKTKPSTVVKLAHTLTPAQALGYYTTAGLKGGTVNTRAIASIVGNRSAPTSVGTQLALKAIKDKNQSWWARLRRYLMA
jgi:hypothetical protein